MRMLLRALDSFFSPPHFRHAFGKCIIHGESWCSALFAIASSFRPLRTRFIRISNASNFIFSVSILFFLSTCFQSLPLSRGKREKKERKKERKLVKGNLVRAKMPKTRTIVN